MQTRRKSPQPMMRLMPPIETMVPDDYYLRRLNRVLDLSFVHDVVRDRYCQNNGRPSIDPEVIVRLFLLQAIDGIRSVRELMQRVQVDMAYRWFIGYEIDEPLPDHSTLSRALDRFGDDVFNELFTRSIAQCRASGLIGGDILHVDATTIRADIDADRVNKSDSPDRDARFGRFPSGVKKPGYKQQTVVDDDSRVILAVDVMPANAGEGSDIAPIIDEACRRLPQQPETVCADSAYASGRNRANCDDRGIRLVSPPGHGHTVHSKDYFTIECFEYNEQEDVFTCPAGKRLNYAGRFAGKKQRHKYRASIRDCQQCPLKSQCTKAPQRSLNVSRYHASLMRLRADSQTAEFRALYRRRGPRVEGIFAEAKQWHGLSRAWRRGLRKTRWQCLLIAAVLNLKRLAVHYLLFHNQKQVIRGMLKILDTALDLIRRLFCMYSAQPSC